MTTTFQTEFPDYPVADMPAMPAHGNVVDTSWHNDACPSFASDALGLHIWIDYADKSVREFENGPRFIVVRLSEGIKTGHTVIETNDWNEVLAVIEQEKAK
ncbi:hypothetical protein [Bradyrhizobium sp. LA7.1]|uniref:hypothetical protein n=1 Tax=Bradyrhizobium sp. LA7.1 TaxID=3156324 RepID=UPI00339B60BB